MQLIISRGIDLQMCKFDICNLFHVGQQPQNVGHFNLLLAYELQVGIKMYIQFAVDPETMKPTYKYFQNNFRLYLLYLPKLGIYFL